MNEAEWLWTVPADHPALPGHFPGRPIVPGVVWLGMVQELAQRELGFSAGGAWRRVRFVRPVQPGEQVRVSVRGDAQAFVFSVQTLSGEAVAGGRCRHDSLA